MSDSTSKSGCGCSGGGGSGASSESAESIGKLLKAQVAQSYDAKFSVRIVPAHSLPDLVFRSPRCKPRGNSSGGNNLGISPGLVAVLAKADKAVIGWLARDKANAQRFLADPVSALREAGVNLDRAHQKELVRARARAETSHVVPPGVTVTDVAAEAFPNGRVGGVTVSQPGGPGGIADSDFSCSPRRKG